MKTNLLKMISLNEREAAMEEAAATPDILHFLILHFLAQGKFIFTKENSESFEK